MLNIIILFLRKLMNSLSLLKNRVSYRVNPSNNTPEDNKLLERAATIACAAWNKYVSPNQNIEFELSGINIFENTSARAFQLNGPSCERIDKSWSVEFNIAFLDRYSELKDSGVNIVASMIMHEIAHIYGIGGKRWRSLFDHKGVIKQKYNSKYPVLKGKKLGHDGDHWDQEGILLSEHIDEDGHFAPETIVVMELLGHRVKLYPSKDIEIIEFLSEFSPTPA